MTHVKIWHCARADERANRVKPELLLTFDEIKALIASAENKCDRALIFVLFEASLRTGELLNKSVVIACICVYAVPIRPQMLR